MVNNVILKQMFKKLFSSIHGKYVAVTADVKIPLAVDLTSIAKEYEKELVIAMERLKTSTRVVNGNNKLTPPWVHFLGLDSFLLGINPSEWKDVMKWTHKQVTVFIGKCSRFGMVLIWMRLVIFY